MIIVTGAAGFIGSVLAKSLNNKGAKDLIVVDKLTKPEKKKNLDSFKFKEFVDKENFLYRLERGDFKDPDLVVHMGACADTTEFNVNYLTENNYEYTRRLCTWCLDNDVRFIYASSAAVYGDGSNGFSDSDDLTLILKPLNQYGLSKLMFDKWLIDNKLSKSVVGLRFFNVFGPNEYHKAAMSSVINRFLPLARKEGLVRLFKSHRDDYVDGGQERDFIYVKDVVRIFDFFLNNDEQKGIFNLGTGNARSFNDLAISMLTALGKRPHIEYFDMPLEIRDKYQYFTQADISSLQRAGYKGGFISLEDAVTDYVQNYLLSDKYY